MSSPDDGSQSAEDIEVPPAQSSRVTFESAPVPSAISSRIETVPPSEIKEVNNKHELHNSTPKGRQSFMEPEPVINTVQSSIPQGPTDPRRPRENSLKPPMMPTMSPSPSRPSPYVAPLPAALPSTPQPPEPPAIKRKVIIAQLYLILSVMIFCSNVLIICLMFLAFNL